MATLKFMQEEDNYNVSVYAVTAVVTIRQKEEIIRVPKKLYSWAHSTIFLSLFSILASCLWNNDRNISRYNFCLTQTKSLRTFALVLYLQRHIDSVIKLMKSLWFKNECQEFFNNLENACYFFYQIFRNIPNNITSASCSRRPTSTKTADFSFSSFSDWLVRSDWRSSNWNQGANISKSW